MPRRYRSDDGKQWEVFLGSPGSVLSVAPSLEKSGAMLPEHQMQIIFKSGDDVLAAEYTQLAAVEDLSEDEVTEWYQTAKDGTGL